jgi:hypothetical protein
MSLFMAVVVAGPNVSTVVAALVGTPPVQFPDVFQLPLTAPVHVWPWAGAASIAQKIATNSNIEERMAVSGDGPAGG